MMTGFFQNSLLLFSILVLFIIRLNPDGLSSLFQLQRLRRKKACLIFLKHPS